MAPLVCISLRSQFCYLQWWLIGPLIVRSHRGLGFAEWVTKDLWGMVLLFLWSTWFQGVRPWICKGRLTEVFKNKYLIQNSSVQSNRFPQLDVCFFFNGIGLNLLVSIVFSLPHSVFSLGSYLIFMWIFRNALHATSFFDLLILLLWWQSWFRSKEYDCVSWSLMLNPLCGTCW